MPPELADLCARATSLGPAARPSGAQEMHDAIVRYLDGDRDEQRRRELAADVPTTPKRSGLVWRNAPPARSLTLAWACVAAAQLDLYVSGAFVQTLSLPATGGADVFHTTTVAVTIPLGAEIRIVYEQGKSAPADLDCIEVAP